MSISGYSLLQSKASECRLSGLPALFFFILSIILSPASAVRVVAQMTLCDGGIRVEALGDECFRFTVTREGGPYRLRAVSRTPGTTVRSATGIDFGQWDHVVAWPDSAEWGLAGGGGSDAVVYGCFNTPESSFLLEVSLRDLSSMALECLDTIELPSVPRATGCADMEAMIIRCLSLPSPGGGALPRGYHAYEFGLLNNAPWPIGSVSLSAVPPDDIGWGGSTTFRPLIQPGERIAQAMTRMDFLPGNSVRMIMTVCDSAGTTCCSDTSLVMFQYCPVSDVPESPELQNGIRITTAGPVADMLPLRLLLPQRQDGVRLSIVDMGGREVARVLDGTSLDAGEQRLTFDTSLLPAGAYLCILSAGGRTSTCSFQVLR